VVIGTFEWASLRLWGKIPKSDLIVVVAVTGVTVWQDLAIAVVVGVIISALVFAWKHASNMTFEIRDEYDTKVYKPKGPLFFASIQAFRDQFNPRMDPPEVIVDFANCRVMDHSGIEAIDSLAERYEKAGKELHLRHLSPECHKLLSKADSLVEVNVIEDPKYKVADDSLA
jgi:SulP family sulfate permease